MDRRALRAAAAVGPAPDRMDFGGRSSGGPVRLVDARAAARRCALESSLCLFVGVDCGRERARLLEAGCGDALPASVGLPELARRARRVAAAATQPAAPARDRGLTLDLLHRDARAGERWLALHPREFALLWRLAEQPRRAGLARDAAARRMAARFRAGDRTRSKFTSRDLRAKLALAGMPGLVETDPARRLPGALRGVREPLRRTVRASALCPQFPVRRRSDNSIARYRPAGEPAAQPREEHTMSEAYSAGRVPARTTLDVAQIPARPAVHPLPHPAAGDLLAGDVLRRARFLADLVHPALSARRDGA